MSRVWYNKAGKGRRFSRFSQGCWFRQSHLANNHNAGELLILAFIEGRFGHNVSGN